MKSQIHSGLAGLLAATFVAVASPVLAQTVILGDSFNRANSALNGQVVETWNSGFYGTAPTWVASNAALSGGRITTSSNGSAEFKVATPNQTAGVLTLSADLSLGADAGIWVSLTFMSSTAVNAFDTNNTIMVTMNNAGWVAPLKNGPDSIGPAAQQIANYNNANTYNLKLEYDRTAGLLSVFVDNVALFSSISVGALNSETFGAVGIRFHGTNFVAGVPHADNFLYTTSIPEPSAFAALFGGVALTAVATRRRRQLG